MIQYSKDCLTIDYNIYEVNMKEYPLYETTVFENFRIMCENVAEKYPDKTAFSYRNNPGDEEPVKVTFSEVRDTVRNIGTALIELGCRGEKCAIVGATSIGWIYTYFAVMSIGAVSVPIDKELSAEDISDVIRKAGCKYVFYGADSAAKIKEIKN